MIQVHDLQSNNIEEFDTFVEALDAIWDGILVGDLQDVEAEFNSLVIEENLKSYDRELLTFVGVNPDGLSTEIHYFISEV